MTFIDLPYEQFLWQVLIPIFLWLLLVLVFIIIMFIKYTFGPWTKENPNPYQDETFGMPRGTFRGILTLTLLFVVVILELVNVRVVGFEQEIHELMVAFQMMIAFYFGAKVMHHITSSDKKKTYALARAQIAQNNNNHKNSEIGEPIEEGLTPEDDFGDDQAVG